MGLQNVPDKVFEKQLLPHLDWNDLLRLRRVCKWTKKITDGYLKANPDRAPELEISEEKDKSFGAFLEMGIPTTKLFISNPTLGYRFYEDEKVAEFLEDYGPLIKDLRVTQITLANDCVCRDKELIFMEGLPNLKSLEVETCSSGGVKSKPYKVEHMSTHLKLPETFKKLEKVKFDRDPKNTDFGMMERKKRTRDFLVQCTHLKSISFPTSCLELLEQTSKRISETKSETEPSGTVLGDMFFLMMYFKERPNSLFKQDLEPTLQLVDFEQCHEGYGEWLKESWPTALPLNMQASGLFVNICIAAKMTGMKLANVSPYWFYVRDVPAVDGKKVDKLQIGERVVSLVGLDSIIMDVHLPNLEKITIPSTCFCTVGDNEGKRPEWPSLKILDIIVDGREGYCWNYVGVTSFKEVNGECVEDTYKHLLAFLFCDVVRPSVTQLHLKFKGDKDGKVNDNSAVPKPTNVEKFLKGEDVIRWELEEQLAVPGSGMIVKCCENLKVLKLGNWQGRNRDLLVFWNGLGETLEEVEMENCGNVGDFTFFGKDKETPEFLKLKKLKNLSLKGMDKMSKVTDLLFMLILCQMELKQFVLTSEKPLEKITKEGIRSLLRGPFAESIERFPFQGWSLAGVTPKEFQEMGKKFRSYNML